MICVSSFERTSIKRAICRARQVVEAYAEFNDFFHGGSSKFSVTIAEHRFSERFAEVDGTGSNIDGEDQCHSDAIHVEYRLKSATIGASQTNIGEAVHSTL